MFFFPLTIVTQIFEDETTLSEALNFDEISRFDSDLERGVYAIKINAEETLKKSDALGLQKRLAPVEIEIETIKISFDAPKKSQTSQTAQMWREKINVNFHVLRWQRADGYAQAFVPVLKIAVVASSANDFSTLVTREIKAALAREADDNLLLKLRLISRVKSVEIKRLEAATDWQSPKQRAISEEKDDDSESVLEKIGTNLNKQVLRRAYFVENYVELLAEMLRGKIGKSVLLVGASGSGKTAILQELARQREVYGFAETPFWTMSGANIIAGQSGFGAWQERCAQIIAEARKSKAILHFGSLIELLEVGKSTMNSQGIASFFRPKIARGEIRIIVECTPEELPIIERQDANLLGAFQQIKIEEPSHETGLEILQSVAGFDKVKDETIRKIETEAIKTLDAVHRRYSTYSAFPGRPIRFLRNLLANDGEENLTPQKVLEAFSNETGLPLFLLSDDEKLDLVQTEKDFNRKVLGQTEAVKLVTDLIATVKAKMTRPRKPIASLLFIGATGVGKTEMVKSLAEFFFGDKTRLVRFDMSEFSTPIAVQRLIGGFGTDEGQLTAKLREQPFSVVLLDEFEKADASFFDLLLQILGEGRLTDAKGRVADFTNSIIVMTSNLGAESFSKGKSGFLANSKEKTIAVKHFASAVRDFLRPEIYNRIDRIVPFAPLDEKTVLKIANLELEKLQKRDGWRFRSIKLNLTDEALNHLVAKGYEPRYGARPLRRAIERELIAPLASQLNLYPTNEKITVNIDVQKENLRFVFERETVEKKRSQFENLLATNANRIAYLRRRTQKLESSEHLTELNDERFQLQRLQKRQIRGGWISSEDKERIERLPRIERFLNETKNFSSELFTLEDKILLDIYGKSLKKNDFAGDIERREDYLQSRLLDLLSLKSAKPNEICFAIFSENAAALFRLVRCYLVCIEDFECDITGAMSFTTIEQDEPPELDEQGKKIEKILFGREVWRLQIGDSANFFAKTQKEILGVILKISGKMSRPRFASETGVHDFRVGNQSDKVLTISGDFDLLKVKPNEQLATRGAIDNQTKRRVYQSEKLKIEDALLKKDFDFDGRNIAESVKFAIEELLQKTAANLIS
ncbi:MAG: ATP-dependent Clp protease ATP-binding subunit [Pyrinomonadaceae bacterium]|nr:ATP-dependent Clp protease ATP-binding subunit [Pyrinomonadaceae bacterium]